MKRFHGMLLALLCACGAEPPGALGVVVRLGQVASDVKSFEVFVVSERVLGKTGEEACIEYFANTLPNFTAVTKGTFSFDAAAPAAVDLKIPPGKDYVVLIQGWNVDPPPTEAQPEPAASIVALGCLSQVSIAAAQTTTAKVPVCLLRPGMDAVCPPSP